MTTLKGVSVPAYKEWAVIVHALLEGEQILDVRKGGLREDGRRFGLEIAYSFDGDKLILESNGVPCATPI